MPSHVIPTHRPLHLRLLALARELLEHGARSPLHELDPHTLTDIGISASEIDSIEAEAQGRARLTRLRIAAWA